VFLDKQKLIELGLQKKSGKIDKTWDELAEPYGIRGEMLRDWVKKKQKKDGTLSGKYEKGKTKILVISDQHYPFNLPIDIYKDYAGKVDVLAINGDFLDCYSLSKFVKKYRVPFIEELIGARLFMIELIKYINPKKVLINYGNHSARLLPSISEKMQPELMALMPKTPLSLLIDSGFYNYDHRNKTKTFHEPISKVFNNIEVVYTDDWWCRVGNTIMAHPAAFNQGILKTTEKAYLYFLQKGENPFDCIVLSHTHHQGVGRYVSTFLYETGCTCQEMDYVESKLIRPAEVGFAYIVQDKDGNFLYDESKLICL